VHTSALAALVALEVLLAGAPAPRDWPAACVWEEQTPFAPALDALWSRAKAVAGASEASRSRPRFCFAQEPRWSGTRRILSGFDAPNDAAALMLTPEELAAFGPCVAVHEMLHALLGPAREEIIKGMWRCAEAEAAGGG